MVGSATESTGGNSERNRIQTLGISRLRQSVAMSYRSPIWFNNDPQLDGLRSHPEFRLLMMDLDMPDEPFAASR